MSTIEGVAREVDVVERPIGEGGLGGRRLLACGVLSSTLYVATDILGGLRYPGYSFASQAISELMATGAPSEALVDPLFLAYGVLALAFGVGVIREAAGRDRTLRLVGTLLIAYSAAGLTGPTLLEMRPRGAGVPESDFAHIALTGALVLVLVLAIGFGAFALGQRFRVYSFVTLLTIVGFGALSAPYGARLAAGEPTPGFGIVERIHVYGALLWVAVLAIALLRRASGRAGRTEPRPLAERPGEGSRTRGIEEAPGVPSVSIEGTARVLPVVIPLISGLLLSALPGGALEAQPSMGDTRPVRGEFGGTLFLAAPVGEFDRYVGLGGGVSGFAVLFLDELQTVGLRLDGSFMIYGDNTVRRPLSPTVPFVDVDVTTRNGIASFGLGPQVQLGQGPVRPYLRGSVGFSYFATTTSVEGTNDFEPFASSTNFDDWTLALTGGGGLRIGIAQAGDKPIALDLGVTYVRNGETDYLREGGIREGPGGSVIIEPIRSETNLVKFHLGVAVGLR